MKSLLCVAPALALLAACGAATRTMDACSQGAIGEACLCGGSAYSSGYCCGGAHQAGA